MKSWIVCYVAAMIMLMPSLARAQEYCTLNKITVEPVTNGLIIHLHADGLLDACYAGNFNSFTPQRRISFLLKNVRSAPGAIVDIRALPHQPAGIFPSCRFSRG